MHFQRSVRIFGVIMVAADLVHFLMKASTQHDIQFLESTADRKQRYPGRHCLLRKRQGCRVAVRIMQRTRLTGIAIIVMWFDVGRAACQEQAIHMTENGIQIEAVTQSGYEKWHRICTVANRRDVFLPNHMKGMRVELTPVRRYSYDRSCAHEDLRVYETTG